MLSELNNAASYQKIAPFQIAPASYKKQLSATATTKNPSNQNPDSGDSDRPKKKIRGVKDKGWFSANGTVRWPQGLNERICTRYAQIGSVCRNESCEYKHKTYPHHFSDEERRIVYKWITETPHLEFGPNVNYVPKNLDNNGDESASEQKSPKKKPAVTLEETEENKKSK